MSCNETTRCFTSANFLTPKAVEWLHIKV
jgi:hypothetical protein